MRSSYWSSDVCSSDLHGVEVLPVDVNFSDWDCTLEPFAGYPVQEKENHRGTETQRHGNMRAKPAPEFLEIPEGATGSSSLCLGASVVHSSASQIGRAHV